MPSIEKNNTVRTATYLAAIFGFNENPFTTVKTSLYRMSDLSTLIQSVVHSSHPGLSEPINVQYQDMKLRSISSKLIILMFVKIQSLTILSVMYKKWFNE